MALFLSLSLDGRDESWPTIDGNITWEETDIGVLRYLPEGAALDIFASTTFTSFSANHTLPADNRSSNFRRQHPRPQTNSGIRFQYWFTNRFFL